VALLASRFLADVAERSGRRARELDAEAIAMLETLPFPGNVRQLRNLMEAANVLAEDRIGRADLERILESGPALSMPERGELPRGEDPFDAPSFEDFKNRSEALFFQRKLAQNDGNVKRTAETLGMQRSHLYKKLDRYGLR
jgi:DNA-binding NtrC family response regulator